MTLSTCASARVCLSTEAFQHSSGCALSAEPKWVNTPLGYLTDRREEEACATIESPSGRAGGRRLAVGRGRIGSEAAVSRWEATPHEEEEEEEEVGGMQHSADTDTRRLARPTWPGQRRPPPGAWEEAAGHGPGRQAAAPLSARRPRPPRCLGAAGRWDRG
ncbi:unnamed protein product [Prorocentrum cordatum]|uniref:Uncharacterized protein n=1 Tax=Prorocentrum cordatum TaxID=2364126 RepID=A0ABN9YA90_9DINO|nr:unnamed protein product [Polarella glacialis]